MLVVMIWGGYIYKELLSRKWVGWEVGRVRRGGKGGEGVYGLGRLEDGGGSRGKEEE